MLVYQTNENRFNSFFRTVVTVWIAFFVMTSMVVILVFPENAAHSMTAHIKPPSSQVLATGNSDPCRVLLHSVSTSDSAQNLLQKTGVYALNRSQSSSQSTAGTTAALAFMLGKQFAIAPTSIESAAAQNRATADGVFHNEMPRTTSSIVAYRQCKKDIALKALGNK